MKILTEYSIANIKKNKLTSIGTTLSILIAAIFITTILILSQSFWNWFVNNEITMEGNWHSQIVNVNGARILEVEQNENVDFISVKGSFQTCLLSQTEGKDYLFVQNCNRNYWSNMREQYLLLDGRVPEKSGEIVIQSDFLKEHPEYKVGDTIMLPVGNRYIDGKEMRFLSIYQQGENFQAEEIREFTIVGSIDVGLNSAYQGYGAYGYLAEEQIAASNDCVAYIKFQNPQVVFRRMPKFAEQLDAATDELGNYEIVYNERLLRCFLVLDKRLYGEDVLNLVFMIILIVLLIGLVFRYILKSTFSVSQKKRSHQLGMLKSLGATPGHLMKCILEEGIILSILPILLADFLGIFFSRLILKQYANLMEKIFGTKIEVSFAWITLVLASVLVLLTVIISIWGSVREITKRTPIDLIRQQNEVTYKKKNKIAIFKKKEKEVSVELSQSFLSANKKAFRTSTVMMGLCFILLFFFLATFIISDISNNKSENESYYNLSVSLKLSQKAEEELLSEVKNLSDVQESVYYSNTNVALRIEEEQFAASGVEEEVLSEFEEYGYMLKERNQYRVTCELVGVEDSYFNKYLQQESIQIMPGNSEEPVAILVEPERITESVSTFNWDVDEDNELTIYEKYSDVINSNAKIDVALASVTSEVPMLDLDKDPYSFRIIVPISTYYEMVEQFLEERRLYHYSLNLSVLCEDAGQGELIEEMKEIFDKYLGKDDYVISSKAIRLSNRANMNAANKVIIYAVTILLAFIGLASEVFAVLNSVQNRRREFVMLRSIGLDEDGVRKILKYESVIFSVRPFVYAVPILFVLIAFCLWSFEVTWSEFFKQFPIWQMLVYLGIAVLSMKLVYSWGNRVIVKDKIIDIIKKEYL